MNDDLALLRDYARNHSEDAFSALVSRHVNLVYSVALRQVGDAGLAEEITQAVFIILARKAGSLGDKTILGGWLCRTARYVSANAATIQRRRQRREQEAFMQTVLNEPEANETWRQIAPLLDAAMEKLGQKDHDALVLRFFEDKNFAEVGTVLGTSEDAAKMRVSRALEKLRKFFFKRGVDSSVSAIGESISINSIQVAPVTLAKIATATAIAKGATASISTLTLINGALKIMAWTKAKTAIVAGAAVLLTAGTTTTTLTIYHLRAPMRNVQSEWSAIGGNEGQWSWSGGKIEAHSVDGNSVFASSKKYGDVTFSAVASTPNREASLGFRLQDAENGYFVVVAPGHTTGNDGPAFVRLNKTIGGSETRLGIYQGPRVPAPGKSAKIKIVAKGSSIQVFLNGVNILRAHDTTFTDGYIGFRVYGWGDTPCDATFTDVTFP